MFKNDLLFLNNIVIKYAAYLFECYVKKINK